MDKKYWSVVFTLTGTIIGAGILGLPYVFQKSGFLIGTFWLFILGIIT
ncbi:MAG: amino acid permease, partial [Bacteroidetes bacterium]|nr:amino acid permease [Bacteroidota bacterium]